MPTEPHSFRVEGGFPPSPDSDKSLPPKDRRRPADLQLANYQTMQFTPESSPDSPSFKVCEQCHRVCLLMAVIPHFQMPYLILVVDTKSTSPSTTTKSRHNFRNISFNNPFTITILMDALNLSNSLQRKSNATVSNSLLRTAAHRGCGAIWDVYEAQFMSQIDGSSESSEPSSSILVKLACPDIALEPWRHDPGTMSSKAETIRQINNEVQLFSGHLRCVQGHVIPQIFAVSKQTQVLSTSHGSADVYLVLLEDVGVQLPSECMMDPMIK